MRIYWGLCDFGVGGRFSVVGCPHLVGAELTEGVNFWEKGGRLVCPGDGVSARIGVRTFPKTRLFRNVQTQSSVSEAWGTEAVVSLGWCDYQSSLRLSNRMP